jgi:hypothetical protein
MAKFNGRDKLWHNWWAVAQAVVDLEEMGESEILATLSKKYEERVGINNESD